MAIHRHPEAEAEMEASAKFYDERLPGLGREFVNEIQHTVRLYAIENNDILVIAIMHQSRKPGYWKRRIG